MENKTKIEIRQAIKALNKEKLTPAFRTTASEIICQKIADLIQFREAQRIALYHALPDEPDLAILLQQYAQDKELYLPRVEGADIAFYRYRGEEGLSSGSYGIEEPLDNKTCVADPMTLDLIIVPGVAFTAEGIRLGRGKAYYDRFLPSTKAFLVGVTFDFRLLAEIPHDAWDFPMNRVVTN